jgi:hypothetical protein
MDRRALPAVPWSAWILLDARRVDRGAELETVTGWRRSGFSCQPTEARGLMEHVIKHDLSQELAKKAAEKAAEHYTKKWEKYDAEMAWKSETEAEITFHVKGVNVAATLELQPGRVVIDMKKVPLLLRPFKNMALDIVHKTMDKWIAKAKRGELEG